MGNLNSRVPRKKVTWQPSVSDNKGNKPLWKGVPGMRRALTAELAGLMTAQPEIVESYEDLVTQVASRQMTECQSRETIVRMAQMYAVNKPYTIHASEKYSHARRCVEGEVYHVWTEHFAQMLVVRRAAETDDV